MVTSDTNLTATTLSPHTPFCLPVSPLYYIAFIKQAVETNGCLFEGKCIIEVAVNLTMVAVVRFFVIGNIKEIALPLALKAVNAFKINAGPLSQLKQLLLGSPKPDEAAASADKKDKKKVRELLSLYRLCNAPVPLRP